MYLQKYYGLVGLVRVFEKPELFETKSKNSWYKTVQRIWTQVNLEQRCKEIQIQMNAYVMFYIELESVEQKKAFKKLSINPRFSGHSRGIC